MALRPGLIEALRAQTHAAGATATYVGDVALYGTRRTPNTNAGDAVPADAGVGVGIHSVWEGPRKIKGGAPVLKRNRTS